MNRFFKMPIKFDCLKRQTIFAATTLLLLFLGCKSAAVFEKTTAIPKFQWKADFPCEAEFDITDTAASYNIYLVFRHTDAYKYNNVWVNAGFQTPGKPMIFKKLNFVISDERMSKWKGTGMDDIWEVRELFPADSLFSGNPTRFTNPGHYRFKLYHAMYDEPLDQVMNVGVRIEKF